MSGPSSGGGRSEEQVQQARHDTENAAAHDAYLQGWAHYKLLTPEDLAKRMFASGPPRSPGSPGSTSSPLMDRPWPRRSTYPAKSPRAKSERG